MIKFLIFRPIAVSMTFLAVLLLGSVAINYIPISLIPDINIPVITIKVNQKNIPASVSFPEVRSFDIR